MRYAVLLALAFAVVTMAAPAKLEKHELSDSEAMAEPEADLDDIVVYRAYAGQPVDTDDNTVDTDDNTINTDDKTSE